MADNSTQVKKGLEGVLAGESTICFVDGVNAELYYRGFSIFDLVESFSFEQVTYLLLFQELPDDESLDPFKQKLLKYRRYNQKIVEIIQHLARETHPMKVLQAAVSALGGIWDNRDGMSSQETFIAYISQLPLIIAAHWRFINDKPLLEPRMDLGYASNFLYLLHGEVPSEELSRAFDKALIVHMEHGFNASTFSARVVASSMASVSSSLSAAIGSLSGPLHGGANERTLEMVEEMGSVSNVETYLQTRLDNGEKIMGMGHRVYKQKDPRAVILEGLFEQVAGDARTEERIAILRRAEAFMKRTMETRERSIYPNVDFYSGTFFAGLGINQLLFTPIFAMARCVGWCAHIGEQWEDNKLYRPKCLYVGEVGKKLEVAHREEPANLLKDKKILIIDDDLDLIEAIQIPLEANECQVSFCTSAGSATEFAAMAQPDLILLDIIFPGNPTAGFTICRELKEKLSTKDIPVVIMSAINQKFETGFSSRVSREEYYSIPAEKFLEKPVNPQTLLGVIGDVLSKRSVSH